MGSQTSSESKDQAAGLDANATEDASEILRPEDFSPTTVWRWDTSNPQSDPLSPSNMRSWDSSSEPVSPTTAVIKKKLNADVMRDVNGATNQKISFIETK